MRAMGQASLAVFYVIFGIITIYVNLESSGISNANGIYRTIASALQEYPFVDGKLKYLDDVSDPEEAYFWMQSSLKPLLFNVNSSEWNSSLAPAWIGSFNQLLLLRFTFKRWALEETDGHFRASRPHRLAERVSYLDPFAENSAESTEELCAASGTCFSWETTRSFDRAGGYTIFFDPSEGEENYSKRLLEMQEVGLFDPNLGTCILDMIVYNANNEMFLQYVQILSFDFSGYTSVTRDARYFNLNLGDTSNAHYRFLYVLRVIGVVMLGIFVLVDLRLTLDVGLERFKNTGFLTDLASMTLSLGVFVSYWIIELMPPFRPDFDVKADKVKGYLSLCEVARSVQVQEAFIAINLLLVSLRTVSLVSGLHSDLGLILKVIGVSAPNFAAFMLLFGVLQMGFVLTSFFAFGSGYTDMSTVGLCIYKSFSMLTGDMIFGDINRVDHILGPIYFFSFYILFYLVLINIFVTLLMSGYDAVDYELQKKGEKNQNVLVLIYQELRADLMSHAVRYGSSGFRFLRCLLEPILASLNSCCSFTTPRFVKRLGERRPSKTLSHEAVSKATRDKEHPRLALATMLTFMAVWIVLMTLLGRGEDSFLASQATLRRTALEATFYKNESAKGFDDIYTFQDVKKWADTAILGIYDDPVCIQNGAWNTSCSDVQLLNRVAEWNIGFLNTTFVRLTIQPACYTEAEQTAIGLMTLRKTTNVECWDSVCTDVFSSPCRTSWGHELLLSNISEYDAPRSLGPFRQLGGMAYSLGLSRSEGQELLRKLDEEDWFSPNAASMVFDWLSYNGNLDMFTHNLVSFSLLETGVMHRHSESRTFPLNVVAGGGYFGLQWLVLILFGFYVSLLLFHIVEISMEMATDFMSSRRMEVPFRSFLLEFFSEPFTVLECVSLCISLATFIVFLVYFLNGFRASYHFSSSYADRYVVPNHAVSWFDLPPETDPQRALEDDWYFFKEFEDLHATYGIFLHLAALNSLFIAAKTIKLVNRFQIVRKFSGTLANGRRRNVYFIIVINLQMSGFALAMTVLFGTMVEEFSSPLSSMGTLLFWVCGRSDLRPLMAVAPVTAVLFFVAFTIVFRFISTNMFLATQLNTFAALMGQCDIKAARREVGRKLGVKFVQFESRMELQEELLLEREDADHVAVRAILKPGRAMKANVQPGDLLSKVNKQMVNWRTVLGDEEYSHIERALTPDYDGRISVTFIEKPKRSWLQRLMSCKKRRVKPKLARSNDSQAVGSYMKPMFSWSSESRHETKPVVIRPSVQNFWRFQGAISEVERAFLDAPNGSEVSEIGEEESLRSRVKRRVNGYLFSRWPEGSKISSAIQLEVQPAARLEEDEILQDGWDVDDVKEALEQMPVTGEELWLDCLVRELEEVVDESPIVEVLRSDVLRDLKGMKGLKGPAKEELMTFYRRLDQVLRILENKARRSHFQNLLLESEQRQHLVEQQNEVLHDYVCELEREFSALSGTIHTYKHKKELMLSTFAGLLDKREFSSRLSNS